MSEKQYLESVYPAFGKFQKDVDMTYTYSYQQTLQPGESKTFDWSWNLGFKEHEIARKFRFCAFDTCLCEKMISVEKVVVESFGNRKVGLEISKPLGSDVLECSLEDFHLGDEVIESMLGKLVNLSFKITVFNNTDSAIKNPTCCFGIVEGR